MSQVKLKALEKQSKGASLLKVSFLFLLLIFAALKVKESYALEQPTHPLIGKLWSVKNETFIDIDELKSTVLKSNYVVLGETHDNMDHHTTQAQVLSWFIEKERPIIPVFEMLSEQQLKSIEKEHLKTSDSFFDKVAWEESGWPDRKLYKPIFDFVISNELPIIPAETGRKVLMQLMKNGEDALPTHIAKHLNQVVLNENAKTQFKEEIVASHCGMLPEKMVEPMILGQRVRDAVMTESMLKASETGTAILIAGSGHGRKDFGVPAYIKANDDSAKITTIAMMEVVDEVQKPGLYSEAWASKEIPFDFVWFTSRVERTDPCEEMRKHMKHHPA